MHDTIHLDHRPLFASGPSKLRDHGRSLRHALHEPPGGDGGTIIAHGRSVRTLTQTGTLIADTPEALHEQTAAIEAVMDGLSHTLTLLGGWTYEGVVMLRFEPGRVELLGPRVRCSYRIEYVQTGPRGGTP